MANNLTYYSQKKSTKNGIAQAVVNKYGTAVDMEYQYCLFRASAVKNEAKEELISIEWGTLEHGVTERKVYMTPVEPEQEPEPVEPVEPEEQEEPTEPEAE